MEGPTVLYHSILLILDVLQQKKDSEVGMLLVRKHELFDVVRATDNGVLATSIIQSFFLLFP